MTLMTELNGGDCRGDLISHDKGGKHDDERFEHALTRK